MKLARPVTLALVASTAMLAACSSESTSSATPADTAAPAATAAPAETAAPSETAAPVETAAADTAAPAGGATLTILDFSFSAATVAAGEPLTITNADEFAHTVSEVDGVFNVRMGAGATESVTIDAPGTYTIVCQIHPSMSGTVVVS